MDTPTEEAKVVAKEADAVVDNMDKTTTDIEKEATVPANLEETGQETKAEPATSQEQAKEPAEEVKEKPKRRRFILTCDRNEGPPPKEKKLDVEDFMPIEVLQTLQQLACPKLGNNGLPCRPKAMTIVDGRPHLPEMESLQQCQHLQQIQSLIHYHEQQVKYRSYIQLDILRHLRKQLNDQMMLHPHRHNYDALVEAAKNNTLTPLSVAERAQLEYFTQMADWTLEARASLHNKESQLYLGLFGRQVNEFKTRMNEITTHEQFEAFGPLFAERIDYHRELIHTLNRRSSVSLA